MIGLIPVIIISYLLGVESFAHQDTSLGISGGHTVNITEAPFFARIRSLNVGYMCGAAIVHPKYLLTSAFCYYLFDEFETQAECYVTVGTDDVIRYGQPYNISKGYRHPKYKKYSGLDYDFAIVEVDTPMKFSERVNAIQLPEENFSVPEGAELDTFGFGATKVTNTSFYKPMRLQKVTMPYMNNEKCIKLFSNLTSNMICTYKEGLGPCLEDDGIPLVYKSKIVGVVSYSVACGGKDDPNIFTFIPSVLDFIRNVTGINA